MSRIHIGVVAALAAAASLAPSALAQPASDVTFGGRTSAKWPVMVQLSRDGRQVTYAVAAWSAKCTDGWYSDAEEFGKIPVSARGKFSKAYDTGSFQDGSATVRFAASISGKVNKRHTRIKGSVRVVQTITDPANGIDSACDTGKVSYRAVN